MFLGYKNVTKKDNVCKILQKLMKIKAIVGNESGTPSNKFVECIAEHADDELKDFIIKNGFKISNKKKNSNVLLLRRPVEMTTVKMNK
jgi:hypothetical protein